MNTKIKKGKKDRQILVYSLSFFLILAFAGTGTAASAVSVEPSNQNVAPGDIFSINVTINSGTDNLQSAHVELNFNTSVLTANQVTYQNLLGSNILNEPDNGIIAGRVKHGVARTASNSAEPVNGKFITVLFQVKNNAPAGISILDLMNVELMKTATTSIPNPQVNDGQVNVSGTSGNGGDSSTVNVSVEPSNQNVAPGGIFSINVTINSGTDNLQSAHVELNFNTSVLTANQVTYQNLLGSDILNEPENGIIAGKVKHGVARTASNSAARVNGAFITVQFQVKNNAPAGISILDLMNVELMKSATTSIPNPQVKDGQVNVSGTTPPPPPPNGTMSWKFISVPYQLENSTVANVTKGIQYDALFGFDPVNKIYVGGVTNFEPLKGYLIHMNTSQDITNLVRKSGQPTVPSSIDVKKGWNLVGTSGTDPKDAETMLGAIDPSYYSIWNFNVSTQSYDKIGINGKSGTVDATHVGTDVFMMQPKVSYWVWATQETSLPSFSS